MDDDVGAPKKSDRPATRGSVEVMTRGEVMGCARWASAFAGKHKDHRYYGLVEDTIQPDFVFRYFAIKDEDGSVRAVHINSRLIDGFREISVRTELSTRVLRPQLSLVRPCIQDFVAS